MTHLGEIALYISIGLCIWLPLLGAGILVIVYTGNKKDPK
jgi:hypothetical protein